jgi:RNA polymerase sigma-70 factor (ECF subfamily)
MNQTVAMPVQPTSTPIAEMAIEMAERATREASRKATVQGDAACRAAQSSQRFRQLVDAHFAFIWRSLRGLGVPSDSADDAAQHVFWIAAQKLDTIAAGRERAFLFSTALGVAANARRARARKREVVDEHALGAQLDDAPSAEDLLEMKQARALLDRVLSLMHDDLRTVFVLSVLEGTTAPEISELLGIPPGTVASRLRRAREAFHELARRIKAQDPRRQRGGTP